MRTTAAERIAPKRTILALLWSRKTIADIRSKRKAAKIYQKVHMSNIVPKNDTCEAFEKRAESKNAKTIPPAASRVEERGKVILPSKNLAKHQAIRETVSPTTKSKPFDISTGMLVKGKKKSGNNVMTKKSETKATLSNMFERIHIVYIASV